MRIAFICELIGTKRQGGEQHAMLTTAASLQKLNHKVDIFSYTSQNKKFRISTFFPMTFRLMPFIRDILVVPWIGRKTLMKIDSKYNYIFASSTTLSAFYTPKTKIIIVCHIIRSQKFETMKKIPKYKFLFNPITYWLTINLEKKSLKKADSIVVLRQHQKDFLTTQLTIAEDKIHIIPNGVDTKIFNPIRLKKKNQIVFVGRGTIPKGLDTLLETIESLNTHLLIVTQKIDDKLKTLAISKRNVSIVMNAKQHELCKYYSESRIFVLPSRDEEQPLTVLEAMACGLPVVVSPKAASDVVTNNTNGYIVKDKSDLTKALNKLLTNVELCEKIGHTNIKKIRDQYSVIKTANLFNSLLK